MKVAILTIPAQRHRLFEVSLWAYDDSRLSDSLVFASMHLFDATSYNAASLIATTMKTVADVYRANDSRWSYTNLIEKASA